MSFLVFPLGAPPKLCFCGGGGAREQKQFSPSGGNCAEQTLLRRWSGIRFVLTQVAVWGRQKPRCRRTPGPAVSGAPALPSPFLVDAGDLLNERPLSQRGLWPGYPKLPAHGEKRPTPHSVLFAFMCEIPFGFVHGHSSFRQSVKISCLITIRHLDAAPLLYPSRHSKCYQSPIVWCLCVQGHIIVGSGIHGQPAPSQCPDILAL